MNCSKIQKELSAYLDGALPPTQRSLVNAHLATCSKCSEYLKTIEKLSSGIAEFPPIRTPSNFGSDVRLKIRAEMVKSMHPTWFDALFRPLWLKLPVEALAVVAAVIALTVLLRPGSRLPSSETESGYVALSKQEKPALSPPSASEPPRRFYAKIEQVDSAERQEKDNKIPMPTAAAPVVAEGARGGAVAAKEVEVQSPRFDDATAVVRNLLTVRSSDLAKAKLRVTETVAVMDGKVISDKQEILTVNLPAQNLERFKASLVSSFEPQSLPDAKTETRAKSKDALMEASAARATAFSFDREAKRRNEQNTVSSNVVVQIRILPADK